MFNIEYSRQAVKFLKSLDKTLVLRILHKIETLKEEYAPAGGFGLNPLGGVVIAGLITHYIERLSSNA